MGTRSTTKIYSKKGGDFLCCMYCQFDGYLSGHGKKLKDFLSGKKIINGICGQTLKTSFNGPGCMAAAIIAYFKEDIGGYYLFPENNLQEYNYTLYPDDEKIMIEITDWDDNLIYSGDINNMPIDDVD